MLSKNARLHLILLSIEDLNKAKDCPRPQHASKKISITIAMHRCCCEARKIFLKEIRLWQKALLLEKFKRSYDLQCHGVDGQEIVVIMAEWLKLMRLIREDLGSKSAVELWGQTTGQLSLSRKKGHFISQTSTVAAVDNVDISIFINSVIIIVIDADTKRQLRRLSTARGTTLRPLWKPRRSLLQLQELLQAVSPDRTVRAVQVQVHGKKLGNVYNAFSM